MAEGRQLTDQKIRMVKDWESLPESERDNLAREIAAAARYWKKPVERRRRLSRGSDHFITTETSQWRSERGSSR